jgi:hypothetical protein
MKSSPDLFRRWSFRLRLVAYALGFAGMAMMLAARGMTDPDRALWTQRSFMSLGLMFGVFMSYYVLFMIRVLRK